jgi:hypothetical protein
MKTNIFRAAAVVTAFLIGVFINNACGEPGTPEAPNNNQTATGGTTEELWAAVQALQSEVADLKAEISELKAAGGNPGGGSGGEFFVDGLYFSRGGHVDSKLKRYYFDTYELSYTYDAQGRISSYTSSSDNHVSINTYTYSGKTVTIQSEDTANGGTPTYSTTTYEYY